jgi:hypothetical protein
MKRSSARNHNVTGPPKQDKRRETNGEAVIGPATKAAGRVNSPQEYDVAGMISIELGRTAPQYIDPSRSDSGGQAESVPESDTTDGTWGNVHQSQLAGERSMSRHVA